MDFTTNDEIGLLIQGTSSADHPLPWHHPYYQRLFEQDMGVEKAMDLYMWNLYVDKREKVHPRSGSRQRLESEHGMSAATSARRTRRRR